MSVPSGSGLGRGGTDPDGDDVRASLAGDAGAFGRLVERHEARIAARMWRACRDHAVCEELVQEVFVKAYFSLSGFRGQSAFVHWLHRIASRVACDHFRRTSRQPVQVPLEEWDQARRRPEGPDAAAAAEMLHALLAQLAPKDRLVLTMLHLEDCSVDEIAERTGWNVAAIRMRTSRARRRLRQIVERDKLAEGWA